MSEPRTFGRRVAKAAPPPLVTPAWPARPEADELGPHAEAFRAKIAADRNAAPSTFDTWRRSQGGRRWLVRALTLASFAPGVVTFLYDAPIEVSIGLEAAAFLLNGWLRRERKRQRRDILDWEDPAQVDSTTPQ